MLVFFFFSSRRRHTRLQGDWSSDVCSSDLADAQAAIADAYAHKVGDEFIVPAVIGGYRGVQDGDGLLCFNFRADRVRQILAALVDPTFRAFQRPRIARFAAAAGMAQYSEELDKLLGTIFPPLTLPNGLGAV